MSIIGKAMAFFDLKKKKQLKKQLKKRQKLEAIINKLSSKAKGLKRRYKKATDEEKKVRLLKEYKIVRKLLKKSYSRQIKLDKVEQNSQRKC